MVEALKEISKSTWEEGRYQPPHYRRSRRRPVQATGTSNLQILEVSLPMSIK